MMATDKGANLYVTGTLSACLDLMFHIVSKIGLYPCRMADSIFCNGMSSVFELHGQYHFGEAVRRAIEFRPRDFQPSDEELLALERTPRQSRQVRGKSKETGGGTSGGAAKKQKREDASAAPCHGQVYHGFCKRAECSFDHNAGRCAAFKKKNPDGPPPRAEK